MRQWPGRLMSIGGTPASEMKRSGIELAEAIRKRERDARERCLNTWRGVFEPSVKVHRGDGAESRLRPVIRKQDRRICQTDNLKEKAKKGDLYGKIIIYFRIGYRGTSR